MGWIGCVRCEKFQCDLMAQTCPLIAPVQHILHRVPCSNKTLPKAPKHYEMLQNMSLVPMGWIECVLCKKFRCDFMAQTCPLIAPVQPILHRVSVVMKHWQMHSNTTKTHQNMSLGSNGEDRVRSLPKILMRFNFCINCTSSDYFAPSFMH